MRLTGLEAARVKQDEGILCPSLKQGGACTSQLAS